MATNYKKTDLDTPNAKVKRKRINLDGDTVGRGAESIARFLGTGKYLAYQTIFVAGWVIANIMMTVKAWDPYPFILLNLAFSTQAAYAAPLILLAQNRQDDRDKIALNEDRRRAAQTKADTEFLARELAGVRVAVGESVTRDYLRRELDEITDLLHRIEDKLEDRSHDDTALTDDVNSTGASHPKI